MSTTPTIIIFLDYLWAMQESAVRGHLSPYYLSRFLAHFSPSLLLGTQFFPNFFSNSPTSLLFLGSKPPITFVFCMCVC